MTDIDPGMLQFYEALKAKSPPESVNWPLPRQRQAWDELCRDFRAPRPAGIESEDLDVSGVHVRVVRNRGKGPTPGVVYFHGGGWVLGSCETHDDMCAEISAYADVVTVLVDYRLAPEHPHPAQFDDSHSILAWMRKEGARAGIDPARIVGAGDSAGGQMTVALALSLRDRGLPQLAGQVLIYPVLGADVDTLSYLRNAEAPCLTRSDMIFYLDAFLGPRGHRNWADSYAVPLLADDVSRLPPAFITVAAHDPLHDDGVRFAEKLKTAGVPVLLRREPALAHSYMRARHVSRPAKEGFDAIVEAIRSLAHFNRLPAGC
jgi:acetyl esterase